MRERKTERERELYQISVAREKIKTQNMVSTECIVLLFVLTTMISMIVSLFKNKGFHIKYLFAFLMAIWLAVSPINVLVNGGIYLLTEKQDDAIQITGVVEATKTLDGYKGFKYTIDKKTYFGAFVTVNGTKYHLMHCGDLQVGDSVTAVVLPKSKFILQINKIETG